MGKTSKPKKKTWNPEIQDFYLYCMKTLFKHNITNRKGLDVAIHFPGGVQSLTYIKSVPNHCLMETNSVLLLFLQSRVFPTEETNFIVSQTEKCFYLSFPKSVDHNTLI